MIKHRTYWANPTPPHRLYVGSVCEVCEYRALHASQLDVHHIDGDHGNNDTANLQTLCANCHRLFHALGQAGLDEDRRLREQP